MYTASNSFRYTCIAIRYAHNHKDNTKKLKCETNLHL